MLRHNLKLPWTLAQEENPHPFPRRRGQRNLLKGERITNAKTRILNQRSKEKKKKERKGRNEKKEKKRKRRIPDRRSEESKKEKIGGKHNNSQSIKETKKENRRSSDQINFRRDKWPPAKGKPIFEVVLPLGLQFKVTPNWRCPTPHKQGGKDRNTPLPLQKYYPRENPIGLWSRV